MIGAMDDGSTWRVDDFVAERARYLGEPFEVWDGRRASDAAPGRADLLAFFERLRERGFARLTVGGDWLSDCACVHRILGFTPRCSRE
jgi:hypothetical protein